MGKLKIYYAHPVTHYGTPLEEKDIRVLQDMGFEVINPNSEEHTAQYKKEGMAYFLHLVTQCNWIAVRPFLDGFIGAGVNSELECARAWNMPCITFSTIFCVLNVTNTRERIEQNIM